MQISRHWRLNPQRYRLVGVRYENGSVSLQERPVAQPIKQSVAEQSPTVEPSEHVIVTAA